MSVSPIDFLVIAESKEMVADEMIIRNSVSRAYYAAYLHARQRVEEAKIDISSCKHGGVHQKLIDSFNRRMCGKVCCGIEDDKQDEIAGLLSLGKKLRVKSDYKLTTQVYESDKETVINIAKKIITLLPS